MSIPHLFEIPPQDSLAGSLFISIYSLYKATGFLMTF